MRGWIDGVASFGPTGCDVRMSRSIKAMNPCPTPPVCEFGKYGCEATQWSRPHEYRDGKCMRCGGEDIEEDIVYSCEFGEGGIYGMCGHRPLTAMEIRQPFALGYRMGQRPEVDTVNVRACDRVTDE